MSSSFMFRTDIIKIIRRAFTPLLAASALMVTLSACREIPKTYSSVKIKIPAQYSISEDEITKLLPDGITGEHAASRLVIKLYDYSSGKEKIAYSKSGMTSSIEDGFMKILCAEWKQNRIVRSVFIKVTGPNQRIMMQKLAVRLKEALIRPGR